MSSSVAYIPLDSSNSKSDFRMKIQEEDLLCGSESWCKNDRLFEITYCKFVKRVFDSIKPMRLHSKVFHICSVSISMNMFAKKLLFVYPNN